MILAIDTSTQWMGLALFDGAQVLYEKIWRTSRRHTVELVPAIQSAFTETGIELSALKAVAVALGPGSFTSLRIGLAVAKGLCLSLRIPVIGVPSLDITAFGQPPQDKPMVCVLKAGRERFAACRYQMTENRWEADGDIFIATPQEIEDSITSSTIICGEIDINDRRTLDRRWRNALVAKPPDNLRRPSNLAQLAWQRLDAGDLDDTVLLAPIYLRTVGTPGE
ncbi:MAG TPA: tRNA (adenosine(37)-N6)-threonylcarbamoyltransferase complex dimerization subunit type 1 TsaB [Pelolinea sp.]|nr:tRNA (adenosine(37)-N6)-threonylcarbamoyltransferase complex dimerization subunit type 1 TsaB [Pelolinea sp.]